MNFAIVKYQQILSVKGSFRGHYIDSYLEAGNTDSSGNNTFDVLKIFFLLHKI